MLVSLDTSTLTLSLALLNAAGEVVEHRLVGPPKRQSEVLPGEVESLLAAHGKTLRDVTGFVTGLGPGSFTGLRIGLSTIKGLAYALKVPAVGASSLAALAHEAGAGKWFACAVVKKGELYVGRYDGALLVKPEYSLTVAQLAEELKATPDAKMIGPALTDYRGPLEALGVSASSFADGPLIPSAVSLAKLVTLPASYVAQAVFALEPHYLRGSGAEENPKFPPLPGVEPRARLKED
ncbi:MAG: tRNA (adenosine(37)-N6)-threonylcarbamoyltransferase complex dimerization subunit type 1 TsaB [Archangium gephyra]|uniref:tRNA (Adenosine(37)-N6)-threonylcarbamoyltransferase complex dimerization subunit type 1 TsaB n=1 Tax=Archangium gephyra TaxID=48 RepID=A0A2W5TDE3_9BACT|nr:MAG: tRNA (adenosine(37)-N6)-threonylcarbamoyltransferase complex dimerization subunit type 1 TsaB [Archangium gephyra]